MVVPSLPGFAFTGPVPPFDEVPSISAAAQLMHRLMTEVLGYERFMVAGGDGGSAIAQSLALQFPDSIIGIHLTDIGWHGNVTTGIAHRYRAQVRRGRQAPLHGGWRVCRGARVAAARAGGESQRFARRPRIVDRRSFSLLVRFAAPSRGAFSKDEMLTNITLYWVTQTIQSSIYGYLAETRRPSLGPGTS